MQCQNFFRHAESLLPTLIEKNKKEGSLVDTNITKLKKELDILVKKKQYSKPLDHEDGAKLLEIIWIVEDYFITTSVANFSFIPIITCPR